MIVYNNHCDGKKNLKYKGLIMKKIASFSFITAVALSGAMLPNNVINTSSLAQENGGTKTAIDAYTDGAGAYVINSQGDTKMDNSPMNNLVFKFGEEAKNNNVNLVEQVQTISTTSTAQEKILAGSILSIVPPTCADTAMAWNGVTKLCEKGGASDYVATNNNSYSCPSGGTLSGSTCLNSSTYTATQEIAGYTISATSMQSPIYGLEKNGNYFRNVNNGSYGAYITMNPDGTLSGDSVTSDVHYNSFYRSALGFTFGLSTSRAYKNGTGITPSGALSSICGGIGLISSGAGFYYRSCSGQGAVIQWVPYYSGYTCQSGGTLSGTTCTLNQNYTATNSPYYTCPSGGTLSGSTCTINTFSTAQGICQSGYTMNNFQCLKN